MNKSPTSFFPDTLSKPDSVIEFITPPPAATTRAASPLPQRDQPQTRLIKEQELTNEQPYRLRLNPQSGGLGMTPLARNIKTLKSGEHHVSDIANVLPKPPPSASIPSKCRYVFPNLLFRAWECFPIVKPTAITCATAFKRYIKAGFSRKYEKFNCGWISSVCGALDGRAVSRGLNSRDWTNTQGLKMTEKWRYCLYPANG